MVTNTEIKNLKIQEEIYYVKDSGGLRLQINPCGSKIFQHRFRIEGKQKIRNGGGYPETSLQEARQWRGENKRLIKQGITPPKIFNRIINDNQRKITFNDMFVKWHNKQKDEWSEGYAIDTQQRANMYLLPFIGNKPIDEISSPIMRVLLLNIQDKGISDTVQKIKGIATRVFQYSVGMGVIDINPVRDLSSDLFNKKSKKHFAAVTDPKEIAWVLNSLKQHKGSDVVKSALDLIPHIFVRPYELAGLPWSEIDFDNRIIRIVNKRMKMKKPHLVPMSKQVFEMLLNLNKIDRGSSFVFPSPRNRNRHISPNSLLVAMRTVGIEKDKHCTHGWRTTASTRLHEEGFNRDVIESQLAHETPGVRGVYSQAEYLADRKKMMQFWSDYLNSLVT